MIGNVIPERDDSTLATRASLLERLKDCEDQASWQEFHHRYRGLITRFALKAGCTVTEAEEVVQDTLIGVARKLPEFRYDREVCAFKTWLLNLTLWRVKDQFRKRANAPLPLHPDVQQAREERTFQEDASGTVEARQVPDESLERLTAAWDEDFQQVLLAEALACVKQTANLKDCQMFELIALRGLAPREVARTLGVSTARVYLAKHRLLPRVREEVARLEREWEAPRG